MMARELLERVWNYYQTCSSYRDEGEVVTLSFAAHGKRGRRLPFRTDFVRPDRFRYEFEDRENELSDARRYVVWSEGGRVRSWWSLRPGTQEFPSILDALSGPTGVSGGSAIKIPSLLLESSFDHSWLARQFSGARDEDRAIVNAVPCTTLRVVNNDPSFKEVPINPPDPETLKRLASAGTPPRTSFKVRWEWRTLAICERTLTLRKLEERTSFDSHVSEQTTVWSPSSSESIRPDRFAFSPPAPPA